MFRIRPGVPAAALCAIAAVVPAAPAVAGSPPSPSEARERLQDGLRPAARAAARDLARAARPVTTADPADAAHIPGRVIVTFDDDATPAERRAAVRAAGGVIRGRLGTDDQVLVTLPAGTATGDARDALDRHPAVHAASLDHKVTLQAVPNDPLLGEQYGLHSPAAGGFASPDADIEAPSAWDVTTGSTGVTVAVLDTGMELSHPALAPQIAYNDGERGDGRERNGVDDDGNGYVDDWRGWNTGTDDNDPSPFAVGASNFHGTHVAGIIGARGNDGNTVTGVAQTVRLLPVQLQLGGIAGVYGGTLFIGDIATSDLLEGIRYAGVRGADIANLSLAVSPADGPQLQEAIAAYPQTLFVAAAGNAGSDNDVHPSPPCTLPLDNIICVGSTNDRGRISRYSNYGRTTVDLFAPGERYRSTTFHGETDEVSGTSMAAPVVAGAAALYKARFPQSTPAQITAALVDTADPLKGTAARSVGGGRLNLDRALRGAPPRPTATVAVTDGTLRYTGGGTTRHAATVFASGSELVVDARATLTAGAGCTAASATTVRCASSGVTALALTGGPADDRLVNDTDLPATIDGAGGDDTLLGGDAADTLLGSAGDDTLQGFDGGDTLRGGPGADTVTYAERDAAAFVRVSLDAQRNDGVSVEDDLVDGDIERVIGHIGPDELVGGPGADTLYGLGGDDLLSGEGGDDVLDGGQGTDRALYLTAPSGVTVNLGAAAPQASGGAGRDTIAAVEGVIGSAHADTLTGGAGEDVLDGFLGTDRLDGAGGADWFEAALASGISIDLRNTGPQPVGTTGSKTLIGIENVRGTSGADTLVGDDGDNVLAPGPGNDTVDGGGGRDTISYAPGGAIGEAPDGVTIDLATSAPQNTVRAGTETIRSIENVIDSPGNDTITGTTGANVVTLAGGAYDRVDGRGGGDVLTLASRRLTLRDATKIDASKVPAFGGSPTSPVIGAQGIWAIIGTAARDTFISGSGDELFLGGAGEDTASYAAAPSGVTVSLATSAPQQTGGGGRDSLWSIERLEGSRFADDLKGGARRTVITGHAGADRLTGGDASDFLRAIDGEADTLVCGAGPDWIMEDDGDQDTVDPSCEPPLRFSRERWLGR